MIEPHIAERLGFCASFYLSDRARTETSLKRMRELGVKHLRLFFNDAELADLTWLDWLFSQVGDHFEILPCLIASDPTDGRENPLHRFLDGVGEHFHVVELVGAGPPASAACALKTGIAIARRFGKHVVIGAEMAHHVEWLSTLADHDVFENVLALGIHLPADFENRSLEDHLETFSRTAHAIKPDLEVWFTRIGRSTWRYEIERQAQTFLQTLTSAASRIYWNELLDDPHIDLRERNAHFGIHDSTGEPKLLGRLLRNGVGEVERTLSLSIDPPKPALLLVKPVLVTGGAGFIGANLVDRLAADGNHVVIYDALARDGVERNLRWLKRRHPSRVSFTLGDLRDEAAVSNAATSAVAVFHLAGQVAVTTSMLSPLEDFAVNARGTVALLEALRQRNPGAPLIFASTNKVYGDLSDIELTREGDSYLPSKGEIRARGVSEVRPLCFHTPYGCSKGTADQYVLDYAHSFGLRTAVLRMSCIYGERQLGTEDQGWVAHFLLRAIAGEELTIYGDGRQVRDILYVGDAVNAYISAWRSIDIIRGRAYNLGGGPANAISLLQLIEHIETLLDKRIGVQFSDWRPGDQRYFVADATAIQKDLALPPALDWRTGLSRLANHFGATTAVASQVTEAVL